MANVLSQEEIDALLGGLAGGQIDTSADPEAAPGGGQSVPFDFTDQDRFLRSRLPTLETIHDRFTRLLRLTLSTTLRRAVEIQISNQTVCTFGDFSRAVEKPASLHMLKLEPLKGTGMLVLPGRLILTFVDLMFGGDGKPIDISPERDFTLIEKRLIHKISEDICRCYTESWGSVYPLHVTQTGSETNIQFVNIAQAADPVHVMDCDISIEGSNASMSLCIPFTTFEPIKDILKGTYLGDKDKPYDAADQLRKLLMDSRIEVRAVLGSATIAGRDLINMRAGDIIQLDEDFEHPVRILVQDRPKFWGVVGAHKSQRALQITGLVDPQKGNRP